MRHRMTRVQGFSSTLGLDVEGGCLHAGAADVTRRARALALHQHIYAITGLAAATGSTRSVSPSTWRTTMRSPAGTGTVETASHSSPCTKTFPAGASVVCGDSDFADQSLFAGDNFVAAGAHGDAHQKGGDNSERDADGERGRQMDAHFGDGRVDQ